MHEFKKLLRTIRDTGYYRGDRTGNGTQGIFGYQERVNLLNGTIPLLTTKKMHLRGIIHELLWFLMGDTSSNTLMRLGVKIWEPWALDEKHLLRPYEERLALVKKSRYASSQLRRYLDEHKDDTKTSEDAKTRAWLDKSPMYAQRSANSLGDLGFVYGAPWRRLPTVDHEVIQIARRKGPDAGPMQPPAYIREANNYKNAYTGDLPLRWDNDGNPFDLIADVGSPNTIAVRFVKTGAIKVVSRNSIVHGTIVDSYAPKIHGMGCIGVVPHARGTVLMSIWSHILARCYDTNHSLYRSYGAKGAYVSPRWLCYENFFNDVKRLPNYERWAKDPSSFELSKDYYGSNCYDVSTCIFAPIAMRDLFLERTRTFHTTNMKGIEKTYIGLRTMAKSIGVETIEMEAFLQQKETHKKLRGWVIEELKPDEGKVFRPRLFLDQIDELIAGLKNTPFSRRHIVNAWIPEALPNEKISPHANVVAGNQCLAACHCMFQFYVRPLDREERLTWYLDNCDYNLERDVSITHNGATFIHDKIASFPWGYVDIKDTSYDVLWNSDTEELDAWLAEKNVPVNALSCQLIQRSSDVPLGVPYNWASYAILTRMVAQVVGMAADDFVWVSGDTHIYNSQIESGGVEEQLSREPYPLPRLKINPDVMNIDDFKIEDFKLVGYKSHPKIVYSVEV